MALDDELARSRRRVVSVLKLVLKSMLECARLITIGTNGLNQVRRLFLSHVPRAWLL